MSVVLHAVLAGFMVGIRVITLTERGNVAEAADEVLPARLPHCPSAGWLGRAGGRIGRRRMGGGFSWRRGKWPQAGRRPSRPQPRPPTCGGVLAGWGSAATSSCRDLGGDPMDPNDEIIRDEDEENEEWPHQ